MNVTDALYKSRSDLLGILEFNLKKESKGLIRQFYCSKCGKFIFGKGSLLRMAEWEERCECVTGKHIDISGLRICPEGCLLVWDEVAV